MSSLETWIGLARLTSTARSAATFDDSPDQQKYADGEKDVDPPWSLERECHDRPENEHEYGDGDQGCMVRFFRRTAR